MARRFGQPDIARDHGSKYLFAKVFYQLFRDVAR
jgi:hypothetical protein